ncbi:glutamate-cysteine ligase [Streptococcus equi subsp. zooepidemicus Sz12is]|uniref:DUF5945 family protein n=1 Tax=Streptococcus equi TaxID=1336 RepID=UPI0005C2C283|nr:glutamate-cysteine ligase [Streptococcus equi subsp. zooepidemicus Sz12is]
MTKDWTFDQPLDDNTPTSSSEERAKIAALFHKENQEGVEDVDYVAAFEMEHQKAKEIRFTTKNSRAIHTKKGVLLKHYKRLQATSS